MDIVKIRRSMPPRRPSNLPMALGVILALALGGLGYLAVDKFWPEGRPASQTIPGSSTTDGPKRSTQISAHFQMCGRDRYSCVVDGDTIWLNGENLRLQSYDTPEPHDNICGGKKEVALANKASARLLALLNTNSFNVETFGQDNTGKRTLATIRIDGRDVGDILISERLARRWPDGDEWWCR